MIFTSPARHSMTLFGFMSACSTPRRCMCASPAAIWAKTCTSFGSDSGGTSSSVLPLTYSISRCAFLTRNSQSLTCSRAKILTRFGWSSFLRDVEFVLGLLEELLFLGRADRHDLEGVLPAVGLPANVEDRAVRPGAERAEDLELADRIARVTATSPVWAARGTRP